MASKSTAAAGAATPAPHSEDDLMKRFVKRLGEVFVAVNTVNKDIKAVDTRVDGVAKEVAALKARPTMSPTAIESLIGELDKMEIK